MRWRNNAFEREWLGHPYLVAVPISDDSFLDGIPGG
jgi:hypothetical protein